MELGEKVVLLMDGVGVPAGGELRNGFGTGDWLVEFAIPDEGDTGFGVAAGFEVGMFVGGVVGRGVGEIVGLFVGCFVGLGVGDGVAQKTVVPAGGASAAVDKCIVYDIVSILALLSIRTK